MRRKIWEFCVGIYFDITGKAGLHRSFPSSSLSKAHKDPKWLTLPPRSSSSTDGMYRLLSLENLKKRG